MYFGPYIRYVYGLGIFYHKESLHGLVCIFLGLDTLFILRNHSPPYSGFLVGVARSLPSWAPGGGDWLRSVIVRGEYY